MSRNRSALRRARFETLEQKQLLAGDVLVNVVGGQLVVHGDELDNQIAIVAGEEAGSYLVRGLDATTVHLPDEAPAGEVLVTGVRAGAQIRMGAGNDLVDLHDVGFRGRVVINMGAGDDQVRIGAGMGPELPEAELTAPAVEESSVRVHGLLSIDTGIGEDHVVVGNAKIVGQLRIDTGADNDLVQLGAPPMPDEMETPAVALQDETPDPALEVYGTVGVQLGAGNDELGIRQMGVRGLVRLGGGEGDDAIRANMTNAWHLAIEGGAGEGVDTVRLNNVHAGIAQIGTGGGADHVEIVESAFGLLGVALGAGNDTLGLGGVRAKVALLSGGDDEDTLHELAENSIQHQRIVEFELPAPGPPAPMAGRAAAIGLGRGLPA